MLEQPSLFETFPSRRYRSRQERLRRLPREKSRRRMVLDVIAGSHGITDNQIVAKVLMDTQGVQEARLELLEGGLIEDSLQRPEGAIAWRLSDRGKNLLDSRPKIRDS